MRQVFTTSALVASFLLSLSHTHAEQNTPPKSFRNYVWGVAPSKDLKKISGPTDGVTMFVPAGSKKPDPLFEIPVAEEAFYFSNGSFYQGDAWLDGKGNFDKMIVNLTLWAAIGCVAADIPVEVEMAEQSCRGARALPGEVRPDYGNLSQQQVLSAQLTTRPNSPRRAEAPQGCSAE